MHRILQASSPVTQDLAPNGVIPISYLRLSTLLIAIALVLVVSSRLSLGIEEKLSIAAARCFIQLSALGLILVPVLLYNSPPLVLSYISLMMFVAAAEAASRPPYVFDSLFLVCFISISLTVGLLATFTFGVVLGTGLDAQYAIPVTGMITGGSLSAVSVAVSNIVTAFAERRDNVELLLALGATRWEATMDVLKSSIILGLTPTLNIMSVTGLVTIPGMMTGQIIGGTPPSLAAKYQLVIMYVAASAATIATLSASLLTIYALTDTQHRVRPERLIPRESISRIDAITSAFRNMASSFTKWRQESVQQRSPFPTHVNVPISPQPQHTIPLTKKRDGRHAYGATSAAQN